LPGSNVKKNAPPEAGIQQQTHRRRCARSTAIAIFAQHSTQSMRSTIIV
jgi:hypothetical protein